MTTLRASASSRAESSDSYGPRLSPLAAVVFLSMAIRLVADDLVVTRNVNLRPDPSTSHSPLVLLKPSERLTLLESRQTNDYFHVRTAGGKEGWVRALNVRVVPSQPVVTPLPPTPVQPTHAARTPSVEGSMTFFPLASVVCDLGRYLGRSRDGHSGRCRGSRQEAGSEGSGRP